MRFQRTAALLGLLVLWLALGPWVLVVVLGLLFVVRFRAWLRPTWRVTAVLAAVVAVGTGLVVVVPDGWLPIPPGPGALVTPAYVGRPAAPRPVTLRVPQHPGLTANGASSTQDDAWATGTSPWAGPLGESPEVDTAWYGLEECAGGVAFDGYGRLVALCGDLHGPQLRVIDPDSMRPLVTKDLPDRPGGGEAADDLCGGASFYLDDQERVVVATADRHVLVVETADAAGDPDLTTVAGYDLSQELPADDCLVALLPAWRGDIWYATRDGRVGTIDPDSGKATVLDLGEGIANSLAVDRDGAYVVTTAALYRVTHDGERPRVAWRAAYDRGSGRKSGQLSQGSGTTPTLLPGGLVAIADNANPTLHVAFHRRSDGGLVCQTGVFEDDESATESSLVAVGSGVVVENNHGYSGRLSTMLGRTTAAGLARVDVVGGKCSVRWTSDQAAPSSGPKLSLENGLLYAYTKRHSWWGANAWYLSALDVRTGRTVFSVRTGLGSLLDNHYAAVTLAPDGSAYVATLGGMVRVRDRD